MALFDLIKSNRSCRRFHQNIKMEPEFLRYLVDHARLSASAGNLQPLKYMISTDEEKNEKIFSCLGWAAYLKDWKGPKEGEKPSAYIVILGDRTITENFRCDHGIAAQSILLAAREKGFAGCMLAAINHKKLRDFFAIDDRFQVLLVLALGTPAEEIALEPLKSKGEIRYWRDEKGVHHVPKRSLDDLIISRF
ncbi:MAG: nitroreductase family protein [Desulfobacteraceae bacterium]